MIEDAELVEQARSGDSGAFAELYERYFDRVYDFLARMVRSDAEAADLAQDTFLRAMNSLSTLAKGASFKSWLFTIARNTALNRLERASRSQPLEAQNDAGESVPRYEVIDSDQFANPEAAAEAEDLASIVWEAAAALDPKSYSVLHLTVREGLDSAEIAGVLGVTRNNAYVMVNRMKKALEDAIGALALFKNGRSQCRELDVQLRRFEDATMSPEVRRLIDQHARTCATCSERRSKLASPFGIFAGMAAIRPMAGVKDGILGNLQDAFAQAGPAGSVSGAGASDSMGAGSGSDGNGSASQAGIPGPSATTPPSTTNAWPSANDAAEPEPRERRRRKAAAVLGAVALLLLLGGITAFALGSNGDDEADGETALLVDSTPGATDTPSSSQTATLTATQPAATSTPPTPVHAEDGSQPGLAPGGGGPDATSTPAAAPPAAPDPGGPSDTVTPSSP